MSMGRCARLLCGAATIALATAGIAHAAEANFSISPQRLDEALNAFSEQSQQAVLLKPEIARELNSPGVTGSLEPEDALARMLAGTGLTWRREGNTFLIVQAGEAGSAAGNAVQALIVTAQKREEDIQDVPIAISAFSQEDLTRSQVAGGPDLMTQVPNMTFTKTNFTGYSIQIRGIGTQAISATTDAAVAVAMNNTPFIRNRFFEQEFYDLERVEVLRGPQGTLYGRNATAGVVNIITAKPKFYYEARASADVANYKSTRVEAMVNVPLVEDAVALRLAGAWTKRDGYVTNEITGNPIDGRDLWSTRLSLRAAPNDRFEANLIWEHFDERDDRLRSGKQLCKTDEITQVNGRMPDGAAFSFPTTHYQSLPELGIPSLWAGVQGTFSQGCEPSSLYSPDSFQTPNGLSLPYYAALNVVFLPAALDDPYASRTQSHDLRVIESTVDPQYRAKSDTLELQLHFDLTDDLTLTSETAYSADSVFAMQDFNRFNTAHGAWEDDLPSGENYRPGVLQDGVFCDPQVGCADRLVAIDLSTGDTRQFSQELRLASDFDGPLNFSLGANFLRADVVDKYYVFINSLTLISAISPQSDWALFPYVAGQSDNSECLKTGPAAPDPNAVSRILQCTYIDPNPIGSLNDQGHNYFLSKNPYKLISYAAFGELYYNIADSLKVTAGLRWTVDKKQAPLIPSWLFAGNNVGYPVAEVVDQEWREPTGRLAIDWKPDLSFTDETLLYASYAHGYKAGGANPPTYGKALYHWKEIGQTIIADSATHPKTFDAEFVDAFEVGTKNTFLGGELTLNLAGFYYDYEGYQISQIVDRSASNQNFDAEVWGLEIEADWRPLENLRLGFKGGYENTRVADGEKAIDIMDRTAGHEGWVVVRPFPSVPSNCVLPSWLYVGSGPIAGSLNGGGGSSNVAPQLIQVGGPGGGNPGACEMAYVLGHDPVTNLNYVPDPVIGADSQNRSLGARPGYPGWDPSTAPNNGEGFDKDLSGNDLPNAPHFTATITADYTIPLPNEWLATLHTDIYYQSEAWTRIFNTEGYDKLKAYTNVNLAAIFTNEEAGWKVMAYVKNVFDRDSITGAFLNSDDTGLTTNVFLTEPRLYGIRVTKSWDGGPLLGNFGARRYSEEPYPFTIELGGQIQSHEAADHPILPSFIGSFSPTLDPRADQNIDLDRGDGRNIKVTYVPAVSWRMALAARYGKTNGFDRDYRSEPGDTACMKLFPPFNASYCVTNPSAIVSSTDWSASEDYTREEHTIVDFTVGHDLGLGLFGEGGSSAVSAGLRYAQLHSLENVTIYGIPDWNLPDGAILLSPKAKAHRYHGRLQADRTFEGAGPVFSWDASAKLFGGGDIGQIDLEWSVTGGALFGKQEVSVSGEEKTESLEGLYIGAGAPGPTGPPVPVITTVTPVDTSRTTSVTVPTFGASVGFSYKLDRMSIGAGYRWERYVDAIDGGDGQAQSFDRTIDGPYFKLAIGFGG